VIKELSNVFYFAIPFLDYLPRTEARRKMAKLNNLFDEIVESKLKSMKAGELDEKVNNNTANLLEHMIFASKDPENPTLTKEELRVRIVICKIIYIYIYLIFFYIIE
jgi:hypothetical protein